VKRYDNPSNALDMIESNDGDYVKLDDIKKLLVDMFESNHKSKSGFYDDEKWCFSKTNTKLNKG
jgi:hypothetical protein